MGDFATDTPIPLLVAQGVALLDIKRPGWFKDIDLVRLELDNCNDCVLGQIYGYFDPGLRNLGIIEDDAWKFGFSRSFDSNMRTWDELNEVWTVTIISRRMREGGL